MVSFDLRKGTLQQKVARLQNKLIYLLALSQRAHDLLERRAVGRQESFNGLLAIAELKSIHHIEQQEINLNEKTCILDSASCNEGERTGTSSSSR